uniref:PCI domain-containing protein n=1 Tax=Caenorhabditis japonica TaxID=281687 RepID=A0A8R1HMF4_CAEJA
MSNELLDDPMDTEVPSQEPAAPIDEALSGRESLEPAPPPAIDHFEPPAATSKSRQILDLISNSLSGVGSRSEEKRDRENFDETYDLSVNEPAVDVEAVACCYAGNAFFIRGRFIAKHCPPLRTDIYIQLINHLRDNTKDILHYHTFFNELEAELSKDKLTVNHNQIIPVKDVKWIEETTSQWNGVLDILQADYKRHKDEGVKESTRRAMEDLFQHFISAGKIEDAIRLYSRGIRDYCTQLKHSIHMWLNWIEVAIIANDWARVESVTSTAFRSLKDADDAEKNSQSQQQQRGENVAYMADSDLTSPAQSNRQLVESALAKCQAAQVLLRLRQQKYQSVVETVLAIKTEHLQAKWFVTSSDLGIYAMLCAMATLERGKLKSLVGGSGAFRKLLESEPQFIELLNSYTSSRFGRCFEIMFAVKNRLLLDPFLSREVNELFNQIRQKCVVQYLQPYSTVRMETMCAALGTTLPELQNSLLDLIENQNVAIKIDQSAGLLRMIDNKDEETTLIRVNETCDRAIIRAKSILWKTTLAGANIHSISEKELRQKRKKEKESGRPERSAIGADIDDDVMTSSARGAQGSTSSAAIPMSDDFNVAFDQPPVTHQQFMDELGDI